MELVEECGLSVYVSEATFPSWDHLVQEFWRASEFDVRGRRLVFQSKEIPSEIVEKIVAFAPCRCDRCHRFECPFRTRVEDDYFLICTICHCCYDIGEPCHTTPCIVCASVEPPSISTEDGFMCYECFTSGDDSYCAEIADLKMQSKVELCVENPGYFHGTLSLYWIYGFAIFYVVGSVLMMAVSAFIVGLCVSIYAGTFDYWIRRFSTVFWLLCIQLCLIFFGCDCQNRVYRWW